MAAEKKPTALRTTAIDVITGNLHILSQLDTDKMVLTYLHALVADVTKIVDDNDEKVFYVVRENRDDMEVISWPSTEKSTAVQNYIKQEMEELAIEHDTAIGIKTCHQLTQYIPVIRAHILSGLPVLRIEMDQAPDLEWVKHGLLRGYNTLREHFYKKA